MAEVFGKYQMLTRIAAGGMAEVWLARSSSIGGFEKLLAIKKMHATLSRNQSFVSMFIDEAKLTVSLNHPNIVQIFDFGRVDDDYFMAMEYVEGFDLATLARQARKQDSPMPVDMCVYIIRSVFDGLAYAHTRGDRFGKPIGIIHRDVSPQNVLVSFDGHVKVSDFGIARAASKADESRRGEVIGKIAYVSPEQCRGEPITPATDIWAAGVILHELLTNQRLFSRESDYLTLAAVAEAPVPSPRSLNVSVPHDLDRAVLQILDRHASRRPSSAREVAEVLAEILRRHYPGASAYRLGDVISGLWDHHLPRLIPVLDDADDTRDAGLTPAARDSTKRIGERTAGEIVAVRRRARGASETSAWSEIPEHIPPRPESVTRAAAKTIPIEDMTEQSSVQADETASEAAIDPGPSPLDEIARLKRRFAREPNLWVLVDIGRVYETAGMTERAMGAYKLAAAKFAQCGLLVQAATIYCLILSRIDMNETLRQEIKRLRALQGVPDQDLLLEIFDVEDGSADFSEYSGIFGSGGDKVAIFSESPILSSLNAEQLIGLVQALKLRAYCTAETIIREGDGGDSFFMIGRGRVLVSTTNFAGNKIYVTSLADGDCFGEHGFFTGDPRNATVEALEDTMVLEFSKEVLNRLIQDFPTVRESLQRFYKDRIAESLLAKSPLFGHLGTSARKMFAERFSFESYEAGDLIIREGDRSDAFYAIKSGRVFVYTGPEEMPIQLAELGPGEIFGEMAALEGTVRTASVRALDDSEILRLEAAELNAMLAKNIEIRRMIEETVEERAEERLKKIIDLT